MTENKIFIRITNREIYEKLECIESKLNKINIKSKLAFWMASVALTICLLIIGALIAK